MKKLLVIAVSIFCVTNVFSQNEFSLSGGMAFPAGDFANASGGAAKIGFQGDLLYQHQTQDKSKLWIAGMARFQSFKVDISQFEQSFPGTQITATNWSAFSFLVGPVVKFDLTETSSFEPRILLGYMTAKSPSVTAAVGTASATANSANGGAFATMLGASFKFKASDKMKIVAGFDYLTANPKFNVTATSLNGSASQESNQQISSFSVTVGLCFKLK
jgi:hypothetical protein